MPIRLGHVHIVNFKITFWFIISETDPCTFIFFSLFSGLFFFFSPPFPPCFCLLVTLVSRYPFWQLSINHNMDVPDKDVHYPVRYRLYMPWTPSYNTHRKSLKQKPFLWNFLKNFLHSLFTPLFPLKYTPHLPQRWAMCILETTTVIVKSTLGKGKCTVSVLRFLMNIVIVMSGYYRKTANQSTGGVMNSSKKVWWVKLSKKNDYWQ